jgi:23S rRNA pseudouridine2605 synthase
MRLVKFLASCGVASRRAAEEIIRSGRVTVAGAQVTDPARDVTDADDVRVDGSAVVLPSGRAVYMVNKPAGVVSTASDPQRRRTIVSLVSSSARLYPVGRLDIDTTGLILLTDDGDLAYRLTHPSFEVPRTYRVRVRHPPVADRALRELRAGVRLEDGLTAPARVRRLSGRDGALLEITIHEGRKRQVKRMCEAVGHRVAQLERVAFGPLTLGDLAPGAHRLLTAAELEALHRLGRSARRGAASSSAARGRPSAASAPPGGRRRAAGS